MSRVGGQGVVPEVDGGQVGQTRDGGEGVMVHQTVAREVQVVQVGEVGQGEDLLYVVVGQDQVDQGGGVLGDGDVGQSVVGQVQMTQVHQFVQSCRV